VVKVGAIKTAAFKLKVRGTTTPEMTEDALVSFGWFLRIRRLINEISVSAPPRENDAIIEISANIWENVLQDECDLPPEIFQPVVMGFGVEDSPVLCFGEYLIKLPYNGRMRVVAYNEPYGVLADKWFKINAISWNKIEFTPES
jgi:hypothetical protein